MGRKPNQLILEFFERGPKLEDASNRYQHTCKSCGEKFPKGRIDSLTNHLVKKCPALPLRDRQRALLQFHDLPADLPDMAQMTPMAPMAPMSSHQQNGPTLNLPFVPSKQGLSALETLAEVSRQHLDLSGKRVSGKQGRMSPPPSNSGGNQGAFMDEFIIHDDRPDGHDMGSVSQGMDMSNAPALPSLYQFNGPLQHSPTNSPHLGGMPFSSAGSMNQMAPSLVMTASAANELSNIMPLPSGLMEPDLNMSHTSSSDKFFHNQDRQQWSNLPQSSIDPLLNDPHRDQMLQKDDGLNKHLSSPRPLAINPHSGQAHFTTDFSMNQKPSKPKVRGRFSDTRRKEVQEIRKRGACIRCRMLKKPCSGGTPCNTCQNVESARLWKQPCIRTRIAEEFNLYSAGLHAMLAFQAVHQAKNQVRLDQIPGRVEASHYPDSSVFATFAPLRCQSQSMSGSDIDPVILASLSSSSLEIIDDNDDIGGKLDLYMKKLAPSYFESEDSPFMKTTLRTALTLTSATQDGLLSKVLELWNLTRVLTSPDLQWHLFSNPSLAPTIVPSTMSPSDFENPTRVPITPESNPWSYELITLQLQGATEKRASHLARVVMNDLERRLLQRQQANPFETLLVAVVLLACVERMCWLFRKWEDEVPAPSMTQDTRLQPQDQEQGHEHGHGHGHAHEHAHEQDQEREQQHSDASLAQALQSASAPTPSPEQPILDTNNTEPQSQPHRPAKWPFDKLPAYYSQQGERFSDMLNMLLKMRNVPPKSARPAPAPASTAPTANTENTNNNNQQQQQSDSATAPAGAWGTQDIEDSVREWYANLSSIGIGAGDAENGVGMGGQGEMQDADDRGRFVGRDAREWEMRFVRKIIGVG